MKNDQLNSGLLNAMSVDVEDYYQVSAFESSVTRQSWSRMESRVEMNVDKTLALFASNGIKATFFTLGCIAERFPEMIRRIVAQGHELASHGWDHQRVTTQAMDQFKQDVTRTKRFLEDISGIPVIGYRAPSYSIGRDNLWALDVLADAGYHYSSSIAPISHDLYGMSEAPRFPFDAAGGRLLEIPITTVSIAGKNFNCAGGGWFRLYPYRLSRWALRRINEREAQPAIFYFHPWEIDPEQPSIQGISAKTRFRHYLNLDRMYQRLESLLDDFRWGRMDEVFHIKRASNAAA